MRVLGANAGHNFVHFAVLDDGCLIDEDPRRYVMPEAVAGGERLATAAAALGRDLARLRPERIGLHMPSFYPPPAYPDARARAAVETLLELAAWEGGQIPFEIVNAARIRAKLKIAGGSKLKDVMVERLGLKTEPLYWPAGRAEAAAAAWMLA
jgi:hypothetical protein